QVITINSLTQGTRVLHTQVRERFYSIEREEKTEIRVVILIKMRKICSGMSIFTPRDAIWASMMRNPLQNS
ncbi:unnamed protein product, partial [Linum tenue]